MIQAFFAIGDGRQIKPRFGFGSEENEFPPKTGAPSANERTASKRKQPLFVAARSVRERTDGEKSGMLLVRALPVRTLARLRNSEEMGETWDDAAEFAAEMIMAGRRRPMERMLDAPKFRTHERTRAADASCVAGICLVVHKA